MNKYFQFDMFYKKDYKTPPEIIIKVGEIASETETTVTVVYLEPGTFEPCVRVFSKGDGIEFNHFNPTRK